MATRTDLGTNTRAQYDRILEHRIKPQIGKRKHLTMRSIGVARTRRRTSVSQAVGRRF